MGKGVIKKSIMSLRPLTRPWITKKTRINPASTRNRLKSFKWIFQIAHISATRASKKQRKKKINNNFYLAKHVVYNFHRLVCACLSVCIYLNFLKKFLTDFDKTLQDDVVDKIQVLFEDGSNRSGSAHTLPIWNFKIAISYKVLD